MCLYVYMFVCLCVYVRVYVCAHAQICHSKEFPLPFLYNGWHILDTVVVMVSLVTVGDLLGDQGSGIKVIRILRAFRIVVRARERKREREEREKRERERVCVCVYV